MIGGSSRFQRRMGLTHPKLLELKKFAVVYHVDNFNIRVHKLVENAYGLLAQVAGLDADEASGQKELPFKRLVREGLVKRKFDSVTDCLRRFQGNRWVKEAVEARHLFVHRYREEPKWPMLQSSRRFREPEDPMAREIRRIDQATDLDRYAARKVAHLSRTLNVIRQFRDELLGIFQLAFTRLASGTRTKKPGGG